MLLYSPDWPQNPKHVLPHVPCSRVQVPFKGQSQMVKSRGLRFPWHSEGIELGAAERSEVLLKCGNEYATGKWKEVPMEL